MTARFKLIGRGLAIQWAAAPLASAISLVLAIVTGSVAAAAAYLTKSVLDELARGASADETIVVTLTVATAAIAGIAAVAWFARGYVDAIVRTRITGHVERRLFARVIAIPDLAPFENPAFRARLALASEAARTAPQQLTALVQSSIASLVTVLSLAGIVLAVWPPMAIVLAGVGALGVVAQLARVRREVAAAHELERGQRWYSTYHQLLLDARAAKEIRLFGVAAAMRDRMIARLDDTTSIELAFEQAGAIAQLAITALGVVAAAIGGVVVARRAVAGELHAGDVVVLTAAIAGIQGAFGEMLSRLGGAGRAIALFRHYLAIVDAPVAEPRRDDVPPLRDGIDLCDVWFRYTPEGPWVLQGIDLHIPVGRTLGIVGLNGAGKSTLIKLLARFYDPERGAIRWDGVDLRELDPAALRRRLSATFQDFMTYDLSAAENIGIASEAALDDRAAVCDAARLAGVDDALAALPAGYDTMISAFVSSDGDQVAALSGGQWQRIAVARALVRHDACVAILDEPSSNLDAFAEARVHAILDRRFAGKTRIVISHRLGALRRADAIAVLDHGTIVERGTHAELIARGGAYARLFAVQARGYSDADAGAA